MLISIQGLSKAKVLMALFNASKQQGMGFLNSRGAKPIDEECARAVIDDQRELYFDYLHGRVLKVDLTDDQFDPWLYDRDNGEGAAERAIRPLYD